MTKYVHIFDRAKVIGAEGEPKAARALKEASDIISLSLFPLSLCVSYYVSFTDTLDIILGQRWSEPRANRRQLEPWKKPTISSLCLFLSLSLSLCLSVYVAHIFTLILGQKLSEPRVNKRQLEPWKKPPTSSLCLFLSVFVSLTMFLLLILLILFWAKVMGAEGEQKAVRALKEAYDIISLSLSLSLCFFYWYSWYYFRAKVIGAEGEQKAARALKEASDIISESPAALQLRYLQTLATIATEKNSTIIFPLPIDLLQSFMKWFFHFLL